MANAITSFFKAGEEIKRLTAENGDLRKEVEALTEANKTLSEQNDKLNEQVASSGESADTTKLKADLEIAQHNLKAMKSQHVADMEAAKVDADKRVAAAEASAKEIAATQTRTTLASLGVKPLEIKKDGTEETAAKPADETTKLFGFDKVKASIKAQLNSLK